MIVVIVILQLRLLGTAWAGRGDLGVHLWTVQQLLDGARDAVPVEGIRILITGDHEELISGETAAIPVVVVDISTTSRVDVVRPETDLIMIASAIAIFGSVEYRWCRMTDEKVDGGSFDLDRNIPVTL